MAYYRGTRIKKNYETRRADFMNRMSQAFPWSQKYHPTGKELVKERQSAWRARMKRKRKKLEEETERSTKPRR
jgi:hypothetical protein